MSTGTDNRAWRPGNWRAGAGYGAPAQNSESNQANSLLSRAPSFRPADASGWTTDTGQLSDERARTGPSGLTRFPGLPLPSLQILFLDDPGVNPQLRQLLRETPPVVRGQLHIPPQEESRLIREQQMRNLNQLKKHVYNPARSKSRRWCLYYRDNATNSTDGKDDDDKACSICLEDFVPNEELLITPCKHMFHEECILPWVKSNGQCPVCRFFLGETGERAPSLNSNPGLPPNTHMPGDLITLVRAMEEAFEWATIPR